MNNHEEILIKETGFFNEMFNDTKTQNDLLQDLGISTLGDLLGATLGLQRIPFPIEVSKWQEICSKIVELVGEKRVKEYQNPLSMPPLGLRGNKNG